MLVLFNTGYRIGYIGNVFRTMFLPEGSDNEYRYRVADDGQVSQQDIQEIKSQIGEPAVICFGDRYALDGGVPTYRFYPMRRGEVVDVVESGKRIFVKIRLGRFVNARSPSSYSSELYRLADRDKFPLLRFERYSENENDGRYVYPVADESVLLDSLEQGDKTWLTTVQQLEALPSFTGKLQSEPIFARVCIESRRQSIIYETVKKAQMAKLEKDDDVRIVVSYYFPSQTSDTVARALMKVGSPNGAQILVPEVHELGLRESRVEIPVVFEPSSDKRYFSFDVSFEPMPGGPPVIGASESVLLCVKESYWRQLLVWIAVLVYVIGSVVLVKQNPLGGALMQGVALIGMLKFAGKKVV